MALNFRQLRKSLVPRWLWDGEGGLLGYVLDLLKDAQLERIRLGHLARFPQQGPDGTPGPTDALIALGRDRGVVRGIGETNATYAERLTQWLVDRRTAGTAFTLMKQIAAYCGPGVKIRTVDARGNWYTRAADGTETSSLDTGNWDWDGQPIDPVSGKRRWSRFWVVIYPGALWAAYPHKLGAATMPKVGAFTTADTIGTTATQEHVATLRSIIDDWKPANARCVNVIIALDPASFDPTAPEPDGLWGNHSKVVASTRIRSRLTTARYFAGP